MIVKKKIYVELTQAEKEILKQAQEILMDFEKFSLVEQEEDLQAAYDHYDHYVDYIDHTYALLIAVDFIGVILEKGEVDNEI